MFSCKVFQENKEIFKLNIHLNNSQSLELYALDRISGYQNSTIQQFIDDLYVINAPIQIHELTGRTVKLTICAIDLLSQPMKLRVEKVTGLGLLFQYS